MIPFRFRLLLLLAGAVWTAPLSGQNHADLVVGYDPGTGAGPWTNSASVLGAPSRATVDPQWGTFPVDPFGPPYLDSQILSIGSGGSLTLRFEHPVTDDPRNPHGLDFLVYGNAFFQLNADFTTTSGALGGTNEGTTRVWISADGSTFYQLDPALAPSPDGWYPTDGAGDFTRPVDPSLTETDFAGLDLAGIRELYGGSGGGTGYDIGWARDAEGQPVALHSIRYVRFDQEGGAAQIDAISAISIVPAWHEDFAVNPWERGWRTHGEASLFAWNEATGELEVTWDSSKPNSYFYRDLETVLGVEDDFAFGFGLELDALTVGPDPTKPYTFQLALGLARLQWAIDPGFHRGSGLDPVHGPRDQVEFAYFPDSGFGATIAPTMVSGENQFAASFNFPIELTIGDRFDVLMRYTGADRTLRTVVTRNGTPFESIADVVLPDEFSGFTLDTVMVSSYSDAGQSPQFGGSILARGRIDHLHLELPEPPVAQIELARGTEGWEARLTGRSGWVYALERTVTMADWITVDTIEEAGAEPVVLVDRDPPAGMALYRVRAERK
jgi:hypothetical protein